MNSIVSEITKSITGKTSVYECGIEELKQITIQYPYFGPAQFLYSKKLKDEDPSLLDTQKQKTSLYFQNPVWLNYLLNDTVTVAEGTTYVQLETTPPATVELETPAAVEKVVNQVMEKPATFEEVVDQMYRQPEQTTQTENSPEPVHEKSREELPDAQFKFQPIDSFNAVKQTIETPATIEEVADQTHHQPEQTTQTENSPEPVQEKSNEEFPVTQSGFQPIDSTKAVDQGIETPASIEEVADQTHQQPEQTTQTENIPEPVQEKSNEEFPVAQSGFQPIDSTKAVDQGIETHASIEEVADQTHQQPEQTTLTEKRTETVQDKSFVEFPITRFKFQPIDSSKAAMIFEPYHTVDYFASQGIKPKLEEKPKDRFSQQLKSFTEWLKVMKRLPVSEITAAVSASDEKKVELMAAISINDREVVTEAMAEVWEKQGNHAKAIETYEKLSLLNPGKNSFFAAKIEHLKTL
jgi:hypothetical protein